MNKEPTTTEVGHKVGNLVQGLDKKLEKGLREVGMIRTSAFRRFPTVFTLLTTVGVVATFLGIEKILERYEVLTNYPWLMVLFGVATLVFTGALYKKLG